MPPASPLRTCIGCRAVRSATELVRVVEVAGRVTAVNARGPEPGRGASLHARADCVAAAIARGAFGRAFRKHIEAPEPGALLQQLEGIRKP